MVSTNWPYGFSYRYDPENHRIFQRLGGNPIHPGTLTLYGAYGERLATYGFLGPYDEGTGGPIQYQTNVLKVNVWFNGQIVSGDTTYFQDRVGTDRSGGARYRPYGEEITSTSNNRVKFGTYVRDSSTGLDYADQRYYASAYGRFNTPDRLTRGAMAGDPGSWDRYSYVGGDPVNRRDPRGTCWVSDNGNQVEDATVTDQDAMAGYGYHHVDASCGGSSSVTVTDSAPDPEPDPCNGSEAGCGGVSSEAPPVATQGTGGGDGTSINIANWTSTSAQAIGVQNSLRWIQSQITRYSDCDQWLSGNGAVIDTILDQGRVGVGSFANTPGTITNAVSGVNGTNLTNGALLTVNLSGAYFSGSEPVGNLVHGINGGSNQAKLFILLHELAHLTQADGFQPEDNGRDLQNQNNSILLNKCGDFIASVRN